MTGRARPPRWCGAALAALGLAMMGLGLARGEVAVIFTKAINICLNVLFLYCILF